MKTTLKTLFLFLLIFLPTLSGCKIVESHEEMLLQTAKAFTKANIKRLFPTATLERDSVHLAGKFAHTKIKEVFGQKAREFLTARGSIELSNLSFLASIKWDKSHPDSVTISVHYLKKQSDEKVFLIPNPNPYRYAPCLPTIHLFSQTRHTRKYRQPNAKGGNAPQQTHPPHSIFADPHYSRTAKV